MLPIFVLAVIVLSAAVLLSGEELREVQKKRKG